MNQGVGLSVTFDPIKLDFRGTGGHPGRTWANLHDQVWPKCSHTCNSDAGFRSAIGSSCTAEDHGSRNSALKDGQRRLAGHLMVGDVVRIARTMPMKGANLGASSESDMIATRSSDGISEGNNER